MVEFLKVFGHVGFFSLEGVVPVHAEEVASLLARLLGGEFDASDTGT